jgi:hypothetical protein
MGAGLEKLGETRNKHGKEVKSDSGGVDAVGGGRWR